MPHQKLITTKINRQTYIERGLEMKTKKCSWIFSNIYLSFPHNIRAYTSDRIQTLSVNRGLFADWHTRWGEFWSWIAFFFSPLCHYMLISRVDNAVGALMPRSLSQGCCWPLPVESGLPFIRSSSAWTSVKPRFCPWKKEEKENTE